MYTENTFGNRTEEGINIAFKYIKRWGGGGGGGGGSSKCLMKAFQETIASGKKLFLYLFDLHISSRKVLRKRRSLIIENLMDL